MRDADLIEKKRRKSLTFKQNAVKEVVGEELAESHGQKCYAVQRPVSVWLEARGNLAGARQVIARHGLHPRLKNTCK